IFAKLVGPVGCVVAFEPAPREYCSLEKNVFLNGFSNVRLFQAAASDRNGRETFTYSPERATEGKLVGVEPTYVNEGAAAIRVETIMIDSVVAQGAPPPDLIKVDVEGAARLVLDGAAEVLDRVGPPVYIELHGPE